jgi:hypothetical protein
MELVNMSVKYGNCSVRQIAHHWQALLCKLNLEKIFAPEFHNMWVHAVVY